METRDLSILEPKIEPKEEPEWDNAVECKPEVESDGYESPTIFNVDAEDVPIKCEHYSDTIPNASNQQYHLREKKPRAKPADREAEYERILQWKREKYRSLQATMTPEERAALNAKRREQRKLKMAALDEAAREAVRLKIRNSRRKKHASLPERRQDKLNEPRIQHEHKEKTTAPQPGQRLTGSSNGNRDFHSNPAAMTRIEILEEELPQEIRTKPEKIFKKTPEERARDAQRMRIRRSKMTPEEREIELHKMRIRRAKMTEEERAREKQRLADYHQKRRAARKKKMQEIAREQQRDNH